MSATKSIFQQCVRAFRTTAVRKSHDPEGFPGANLPFSIENRYKLTATFILFFGSAFALPFVMLRHQLLK